MSFTKNKQIIAVPVEKVFNAFATAEALEEWLAPNGMTGKVYAFDFRPGGGYEMSLYYDEDKPGIEGKSNSKEDRFTATFTEIVPNEKIVQVTKFDTDNNDFKGEMVMEVTFKSKNGGTVVTIAFNNIPRGIKPEDNEEGTRQSLQKLAKYVQQK